MAIYHTIDKTIARSRGYVLDEYTEKTEVHTAIVRSIDEKLLEKPNRYTRSENEIINLATKSSPAVIGPVSWGFYWKFSVDVN